MTRFDRWRCYLQRDDMSWLRFALLVSGYAFLLAAVLNVGILVGIEPPWPIEPWARDVAFVRIMGAAAMAALFFQARSGPEIRTREGNTFTTTTLEAR